MHTFRLRVCAVMLVLTVVASGQQPVGDSNSAKAQSRPGTTEVQPGSSRAITFRVTPQYPRIAVALRLIGAVQLEAMVRADGTVKGVRVVGGHPVLVEAAVTAVMKWRFEPGARETTESVRVNFGQ